MNQKTLARGMQTVVVLIVLIGAAFIGFILPELLETQALHFPEFAYLVTPTYVAVGICVVPAVAALVAFWCVCNGIARAEVFTERNQKMLRLIGRLAILCTVIVAGFSIFMITQNAFNGATFFLAFPIIVAGAGIALGTLTLSGIVGASRSASA